MIKDPDTGVSLWILQNFPDLFLMADLQTDASKLLKNFFSLCIVN